TSTRPEPFGLTVIEAMQLGKYVVAPKDGGPSETVINGVCGELFEPRDEASLIQALQRCVSVLERGVNTDAIREAGERFSLDNMFSSHNKVMAHLLSSPS
ncbi:unnamed protein product, partial [Ectocarpus sp. 12 AP-2014]